MSVKNLRCLFLLSCIFFAGSNLFPEDRCLSYPPTRVEATEETFFGTKVPDPYRWLENAESEETQRWIKEEDAQARAYLATLPDKEGLKARLNDLYERDDFSAPVARGHRLFYTRREENSQRPSLFWTEEGSPREHIISDTRARADRNAYLGQWFPSPDGKHVAYTLHPNDSDRGDLYVVDVDRDRPELASPVPWVSFADFSWAADSEGFFYTRIPDDPPASTSDLVARADVAFRSIGKDENPASVFPSAGDSQKYLTPQASRDGQWLFVTITNGWTSNDILFRAAKDAGAAFEKLFVSTSARADVVESSGYFYLFTTQNARRGAVMRARAGFSKPLIWSTVVPERNDVTIERMGVFGHRLVLLVTKNAVSRLEVFTLDGHDRREVSPTTFGAIPDMSGDEASDNVFFAFESFAVPPEVYRLSVSKAKSVLWRKNPARIDPHEFSIEQVWYPSKDGTRISMFVVRKKISGRQGPSPFVLEGYGGFNVSWSPYFRAEIIPLLEHGIGLAFPNLRGGGEYGEDWHQAGMGSRKQNSFDDFVAAAEWLVASHYADRARLGMQGTSNGGLLVAAVLTQRPDLFKAAICKNPLTDMVRYPNFGEGQAWTGEYGLPSKEDGFRAVWRYSPYHHVTPHTSYPAVLMIAAAHDDRVDGMHARKMAAALQSATTSAAPILFLNVAGAGHQGTTSKEQAVAEIADRCSFLLSELEGPKP